MRNQGPVDRVVVGGSARHTDTETDTDASFAGPPEFFWQDSDDVFLGTETLFSGRLDADFLNGSFLNRMTVSRFGSDSETKLNGEVRNESTGTLTSANYMGTVRRPLSSGVLPEVILTGGFEWQREAAEFDNYFTVPALAEDGISTSGFFGNLELPLFNQLFMSLAGRLEDNSRFGQVKTYRASAAWEVPQTGPHRVTKVRASMGTGFEAPSLQQLFLDGPFFKGNPDLAAEESEMWDVGIHFLLFKGRMVGEIGYYDGWADNGIFSQFDPEEGRSVAVNIRSKVVMRGVETAFSFFPSSRLALDLNYTWAESEIEEDGRQLFERPKHYGSAYVRYSLTPGWDAGLKAIVRDDQLASFPSGYEMDGYTKLDFTTAFRVSDRVTVYGRVDNLTDKEYEDRLGTGTPGRRVFLGARARR